MSSVAFEESNDGVPVILELATKFLRGHEGFTSFIAMSAVSKSWRRAAEREVDRRLSVFDWAGLDRAEVPRLSEPPCHNIPTHYDDSLLACFDPMRLSMVLERIAALAEGDGQFTPSEKKGLATRARSQNAKLPGERTLPQRSLVVCCSDVARVLPHCWPLHVLGALVRSYALASKRRANRAEQLGGHALCRLVQTFTETAASSPGMQLHKSYQRKLPAACSAPCMSASLGTALTFRASLALQASEPGRAQSPLAGNQTWRNPFSMRSAIRHGAKQCKGKDACPLTKARINWRRSSTNALGVQSATTRDGWSIITRTITMTSSASTA